MLIQGLFSRKKEEFLMSNVYLRLRSAQTVKRKLFEKVVEVEKEGIASPI